MNDAAIVKNVNRKLATEAIWVDMTPEDFEDIDSLCVEDTPELWASLVEEGYDLCDPVVAGPSLDSPEHPGLTLRKALDNNGIKHKDFADAIGILPADLSNIINGRRPISPNMASRIAKALGTSIEIWLTLQSKRDAYQEKTDPKKIEAVAHVKELVLL